MHPNFATRISRRTLALTTLTALLLPACGQADQAEPPGSTAPETVQVAQAEPAAAEQRAASRSSSSGAGKPNIVLVFMDNFGYGELGVYGGGILRGAPTPKIDALADEGMQLLNFNVEAQCTPSRAAIMTGRYAVRTGNASVPLDTELYGLTRWEHTMAEMLSEAGYVTGMFGKWHLGDTEGRFPTDQGFDEWVRHSQLDRRGVLERRRTIRASGENAHPLTQRIYSVMEGRKGTSPKAVRPYDMKERKVMDRKLTDRSIDFHGAPCQ